MFPFKLVLLSEVDHFERGEVRGAVAAEHPPASVSAGFGLAATDGGAVFVCYSNFISYKVQLLGTRPSQMGGMLGTYMDK